jgi:hypothetical protein
MLRTCGHTRGRQNAYVREAPRKVVVAEHLSEYGLYCWCGEDGISADDDNDDDDDDDDADRRDAQQRQRVRQFVVQDGVPPGHIFAAVEVPAPLSHARHVTRGGKHMLSESSATT